MSQLVLNYGVYRKNLISKVLANLHLGPYFLIGSLIVFVALITVTTLIFSTRQVTKGYALNLLEAQHQELVKSRDISDMEISKVRAISHIQNSAKVQRMVRSRDVVFIDVNYAIASR